MEIEEFSAGKFMPYIFLSYSHDDKKIVERIADKLRENGFCYWVDYHELRGGEVFHDEIREGIRKCSLFIEFLSKSYVDKPYCEKEYLCADENNKNILPICLDDVTQRDGSNLFPVGRTAMGYGNGVRDTMESFLLDLFKMPLIKKLKNFMDQEDSSLTMEYVSASEELLETLRIHCENVYQKSGNYCLNKIHCELFPGVVDKSCDRVYKSDDMSNVSLLEYLLKNRDRMEHILLKGDGGMGKTVSMIQTCEELLQKGVCAVYIPLHAIDFRHDSIEKYIEKNICGDNLLWSNLQICASNLAVDKPNLILFIDGINELPLQMAGEIIKKQIVENIFKSNAWKGTQVILSSRFDFRQDEDMTDSVKMLQMLPLEKEQIDSFLNKRGLDIQIDLRIKELLSNPLRLSLYADAEMYRKLYDKRGKKYGIELEPKPDNAGKIIRNFLQTQLFKAADGSNNNFIDYVVLLEYALPTLAYRMIQKGEYQLSYKEVIDILYDSYDDGDCKRYAWYERDRLRYVETDTDFKWDAKHLYKYAIKNLRFLYEKEGGKVEFLHQDFRDYFAAYHIANEIWALLKKEKRMKEGEMVLDRGILPNEVLNYVVDITHEQEAKPVLDDLGWHFPGKSGLEPSEFSQVENCLAIFRTMYDEEKIKVRYVVANLMNIMRIGRNNSLASCDFSELDLRSCYMNGCRFVEWYKGDMYPSKFNGAFMNRDFLLDQGHSVAVTAVCQGFENTIISGDADGFVKIWDYKKNLVVKTFQLQKEDVVDISYYPQRKLIGILYPSIVFVYDAGRGEIVKGKANTNGSRNYRYVRFDEMGDLEVSYDLAPLTWYTLEGEPSVSNIDYDVLAGCAKRNPGRKEIIQSELHQRIRITRYSDETKFWTSNSTFHDCDVIIKSLREEVEEKSRIECLTYSRSGDRFLVAISNTILEIDDDSLNVIQKRKFNAKVRNVCYGNDMVIVAVGREVYVLHQDFSMIGRLRCEENENIVMFEELNGNYYLISKSGVIKELDDNLKVKRMRQGPGKSGFAWVKDRKFDEIQMLFQKSQIYPKGVRYSFDTDRSRPAGWCYEMLEVRKDVSKREYNLGTSIMVVNKTAPFTKYIYENHSGIWIYGCSFLKLKGEMSEKDNLNLLRNNGGVIDEL